jgi:hypothetical protein
VDYSFSRNGQKREGKAVLINATQNELILFDKNLFTIKSTDIIEYTKPLKTTKKQIINEVSFFSISIDSLNSLLENRIIKGTIQSNKPFIISVNNIQKKKQKHTFVNEFNTHISIGLDTLIDNTRNEIKELEITLNSLKSKAAAHNNKLKILQAQKKVLHQKISLSNNIYDENKMSEEIIILSGKIESFKNQVANNELLEFKIKTLNKQLNGDVNQIFNGLLTLREIQH